MVLVSSGVVASLRRLPSAGRPTRGARHRAATVLVVGLSSAALPVRGQQYVLDHHLQQLNHVLQHRLERTYKYQQALDTDTSAVVKRYLVANHKRYLVECRVRNGLAHTQTREAYALRFLSRDTLCFSQARYGATLKGAGQIGPQARSLGLASEYSEALFVEAHNLLLTQTFDPVAVFSLQPGSARTGQWLHVVEQGDTLASYYLHRSPTGDTCQVQLYERLAPPQRPGRRRLQPTWQWRVELAHRRLTGALDTTASGGQYWERTYRNGTDFSEVATTVYRDLDPAHAGRQQTTVVYRREFRRLSPHQAVDTYTVQDEFTAAKEPLLFTILSTYD